MFEEEDVTNAEIEEIIAKYKATARLGLSEPATWQLIEKNGQLPSMVWDDSGDAIVSSMEDGRPYLEPADAEFIACAHRVVPKLLTDAQRWRRRWAILQQQLHDTSMSDDRYDVHLQPFDECVDPDCATARYLLSKVIPQVRATFIERAMLLSPADHQALIDKEISAWHDSDSHQTLENWLGMSVSEYGFFVEHPLSLSNIVEACRNKRKK